MSVKLLTEHNMEFLSLKLGCTGSSESTLVKMPHGWKSHVRAQFIMSITEMRARVEFYFTTVWTQMCDPINLPGDDIFSQIL